MTKEQLIKAIIERKDYRFTHDEMMNMNKKELLKVYESYDNSRETGK